MKNFSRQIFVKLSLLGIFLIFQNFTQAIEPKKWIECRENYKRLGEIAKRLEGRLARDTGLLEDLSRKMPEIEAVEKQLNDIADGTQGVNNVGVFLVRLTNGERKVLKFVSDSSKGTRNLGEHFWPLGGEFPGENGNLFKESAEIQNILARLGMAPQIRGFIPPGNFPKWFLENQTKFATAPISKIMQNTEQPRIVGILMDFIDGSPWAFSRAPSVHELKMKGIREFPSFLKDWDIEKLKFVLKNFNTLKNNLTTVGVKPNDFQFLLGSDGIPMLVDLDHYTRGLDLKYIDNEIKSHALKLIGYFEWVHKKEFTGEERRLLISIATN